MFIPGLFRIRWQQLTVQIFPQLLGYETYGKMPLIGQAIVSSIMLLLAFGIVWLVGWALTKIIKEVFG